MRELKISHPNAKGTGSCLKVEQMADGDIMLSVYPQKRSCGLPGFNWNDCVSFIADWVELSEILMVFRGERESLGDGRGIAYGGSDGSKYRLMLRHVIEPIHCYAMEVYNPRDGGEDRDIFRLSPSEALGLSMIIEGVLHHTLIGGEP